MQKRSTVDYDVTEWGYTFGQLNHIFRLTTLPVMHLWSNGLTGKVEIGIYDSALISPKTTLDKFKNDVVRKYA